VIAIKGTTMTRIIQAAGLAVASVVLAACGPGVAATPTSNPAITTNPQASSAPSPAAIATAPIPSILPAGGSELFAGSYTTRFTPALTLKIEKAVALDCSPGYDCRGDVDVNEPGWLGFEFGNVHGSELDIIRLDKVFDPKAPTKTIDPPADLSAWVQALPGTAVLGPPTAVTIGGIEASQFDVQTPGDLQLGPIAGMADSQAGIGPSGLRIVVLRVHGQVVVISEWLGPDNTIRDGAAALASIQPVVDSIEWSAPATATPLGEAGDHAPIFPGTYTPHLEPGLTLTLSQDLADTNCSPGFECRGYINANDPGWLDLAFGVDDQVELIAIRLDKVIDPHAPARLIDPPADLAAWAAALPGSARLGPPTAVTVGGLPGIRFDVAKPGELQFGPIPGTDGATAGIGPSALRVTLVRVDGRLVLITEWFGEKNTTRDRTKSLDRLQPLLDSFAWI